MLFEIQRQPHGDSVVPRSRSKRRVYLFWLITVVFVHRCEVLTKTISPTLASAAKIRDSLSTKSSHRFYQLYIITKKRFGFPWVNIFAFVLEWMNESIMWDKETECLNYLKEKTDQILSDLSLLSAFFLKAICVYFQLSDIIDSLGRCFGFI